MSLHVDMIVVKTEFGIRYMFNNKGVRATIPFNVYRR